jgi:branched-chain amino acid transport system ATP-binding protein
MTTVLVACGLVAGYRDVAVVRGLDLEVEAGEVVALLGPNGAGKSTTLLTMAGALVPLGGRLDILGSPVSGQPHEVARRGVSFVPENRGIFAGLTVEDNLRVRRNKRSAVTETDVLSYFPALQPILRRRAGLLSGGEQQMLAIAGALLRGPRVLLIDELSLGLAPLVVQFLLPIVQTVARQFNIGVLIVEQHVHAALAIADRAYVLSHGEVLASGSAADLALHPELLARSYLGGESMAAHSSQR